MIQYTVTVYDNGSQEWWLNGQQLTKEEFDRRINPDT